MARVIRRRMGAGEAAGIRLIEAVEGADGRLRLFTAAGVPPAAFAPDGASGCRLPREIRGIAGATMLVAEGPGPVALASGGRLDPAASPAEPGLFAGLNAILAFRTIETAAQIAEGLRWHADTQGLQATLVVNRLPDEPEDLAERLETALGALDLTVMLLDCPVALGKPGAGPLSHPFFAPDAPGKELMGPPPEDRWRGPLGEPLLWEAMKWRFLSNARAVLALDPIDLLCPPAEGVPTAFDICAGTERGVMILLGQRIYPWRVRPGAEARFGDHVCRPFDQRRAILRWGVAPGMAGLENSWRQGRISYRRPKPGTVASFWRAMAIQVPGRAAGELAPKSALIEDPALLAMADRLSHRPVRAPVSTLRPPEPAARRTAIVTTMKNEGPFILEWLAWHRAIGVSDFLIYTNDCSDGTNSMLDLLQEKGLIQHRDNPFHETGLRPQHAALQAAEAEPLMRGSDWAICMDVDEFITIHLGDGTLAALYDAMGEANMISLTWRLFGNGGITAYEDRFVTEQFTRCAPERIPKPHQAWGFKTLFRNAGLYKKLGVHRPKGLKPDLWDKVLWLNGSGRPLPREMFRTGWRSNSATYGYDWVTLNHYAVRSAESFLVKRDRGRVNHVDRDQGLTYWFRMNHNLCEDRSALRIVPRARAEFDRLMADPAIRAAHEGSVAAHRAKIAELRAQAGPEAFFRELTGPRMEKLCRMQRHFGSAVFMAGPEVIPDALLEGDLPEDFFYTLPDDPAPRE
ncbi:glycosyltransferase family 2 protein [Rhodobacter sp. NSM]|uniref:glycosyltransferase family 2 protein n=1 Tax=Rhodobacter sp. NSM TaxID=3457501 RepID=UPI003FD3C427